MADHDNLRYTLDLARACVHSGKAYQALEHLKTIQSEIDDLVGSAYWVEHELIYAGALAGMNDADAGAAFEGALKRIAALREPDPTLEMRAHDDYARYLAGRRVPEWSRQSLRQRAREHFRQAEKIAETLDREECVARFQMCLIKLDLEDANSPELLAFQRLREAAKDGHTEVQQRRAWIYYREQFGAQLVATRKRGEATSDYWRGVLGVISGQRE